MNWGFREALEYLNRFQFHGFRLGLQRMEAILHALHEPHNAYPSIHCAGTNGKGSVVSIMASVLGRHGFRVGVYTSPHLVSVTERFRIGDDPMPREVFAELVWRIKGLLDAGYELSYFEFTTTLAMLWFAQEGVDMAIFETGLGGRLDATNVITPMVSVITPISVDHTAYLGSTLAEIAQEKAGIIKPGVPVVSAVQAPAAMEVLTGRASALSAPIFLMGRDFQAVSSGERGRIRFEGRTHRWEEICLGLPGAHQVENCGIALAALEVVAARVGEELDEEAVRQGCASVVWPCRCELLEISNGAHMVVDGAHNPHGVDALQGFLSQLEEEMGLEPHAMLWACSNEGGGKEFGAMLEEVEDRFSMVVITEPPGPRRPVTVEEWRATLEKGEDGRRRTLVRSWEEGLERVLEEGRDGRLLVVAGSLYLAGAVRAYLLERGLAQQRSPCGGPMEGGGAKSG